MSLLRLVTSIGSILAVVIVGVVVVSMLDSFNESIQESGVSDESKDFTAESTSSYYWGLDFFFASFFVSVGVASIVTAYYTSLSPGFAVLSFFLVLMLMAIPYALQDVWETFSDDSVVRGGVQNLPITDFFMSNYVVVSLLFSAVSVVAGVIR